jgi:hypothetical protein
MKSSFLIIADRGNLKAFRVEKTANERPPRLQLIEALSLVEAHRKISEMNTDLAGRFSVGGAAAGARGNNGRHQNSISDRHYEIEMGRRICRQLACHIASILRREQPDHWSFAAPPEINDAILDELEPGLRRHIAENIRLDLVNATAEEVLERFSVRPIEFAA